MNLTSIVDKSKLNMPKISIFVSLLNVIIASLLISYSFLSLLDANFKIGGYAFVAGMSVMLISIIVFVITCIISIIVILFDNRFSMKFLYIFTHEYIGRTLLVTGVFVYLNIVLDLNISKLVANLIANSINIILLFKYYKKITLVASINKIAARLIVVLIMIFNIFMAVYF